MGVTQSTPEKSIKNSELISTPEKSIKNSEPISKQISEPNNKPNNKKNNQLNNKPINKPNNKKNNQLNNKPINKPNNKTQIKPINSILKNREIRLIKKSKNYQNNSLKYDIEGGSGFEAVKFTLDPGQNIIANGGAMNYMSSGIIDTVQVINHDQSFFDGFKKIAGRAFSGSSIFYNIYENTSTELQFVSFSSNTPGNIGTFLIPDGRELNIVSDSYICNTNNLNISGSIKFGGILLGYGLFFINVKLKDGQKNDGIVWISSYGDLIEYKLKPGEKIIVNNGVFVAFDSLIDIHTRVIKGKNTFSTVKSFLFSGEGLISEMINNTSSEKSIFLQSRSRIFYNDYIRSICSSEKENSSIFSSLFDSQ